MARRLGSEWWLQLPITKQQSICRVWAATCNAHRWVNVGKGFDEGIKSAFDAIKAERADGAATAAAGKPKAGSPIVDEALLRIAALYKIEDGIRGKAPDHRRAVRQKMSCPLVNAFFDWLSAQAARVSRKSKLGLALAYMLKRQTGFRLFLEDGHVDMDSNLVENAIRSPAMNRRNALFAGHDEGGRAVAWVVSPGVV
jgi:hypothetical protein